MEFVYWMSDDRGETEPFQLMNSSGVPQPLDASDPLVSRLNTGPGSGHPVQICNERGDLVEAMQLTEYHYFVDENNKVIPIPPGSIVQGEFEDEDEVENGNEEQTIYSNPCKNDAEQVLDEEDKVAEEMELKVAESNSQSKKRFDQACSSEDQCVIDVSQSVVTHTGDTHDFQDDLDVEEGAKTLATDEIVKFDIDNASETIFTQDEIELEEEVVSLQISNQPLTKLSKKPISIRHPDFSDVNGRSYLLQNSDSGALAELPVKSPLKKSKRKFASSTGSSESLTNVGDKMFPQLNKESPQPAIELSSALNPNESLYTDTGRPKRSVPRRSVLEMLHGEGRMSARKLSVISGSESEVDVGSSAQQVSKRRQLKGVTSTEKQIKLMAVEKQVTSELVKTESRDETTNMPSSPLVSTQPLVSAAAPLQKASETLELNSADNIVDIVLNKMTTSLQYPLASVKRGKGRPRKLPPEIQHSMEAKETFNLVRKYTANKGASEIVPVKSEKEQTKIDQAHNLEANVISEELELSDSSTKESLIVAGNVEDNTDVDVMNIADAEGTIEAETGSAGLFQNYSYNASNKYQNKALSKRKSRKRSRERKTDSKESQKDSEETVQITSGKQSIKIGETSETEKVSEVNIAYISTSQEQVEEQLDLREKAITDTAAKKSGDDGMNEKIETEVAAEEKLIEDVTVGHKPVNMNLVTDKIVLDESQTDANINNNSSENNEHSVCDMIIVAEPVNVVASNFDFKQNNDAFAGKKNIRGRKSKKKLAEHQGFSIREVDPGGSQKVVTVHLSEIELKTCDNTEDATASRAVSEIDINNEVVTGDMLSKDERNIKVCYKDKSIMNGGESPVPVDQEGHIETLEDRMEDIDLTENPNIEDALSYPGRHFVSEDTRNAGVQLTNEDKALELETQILLDQENASDVVFPTNVSSEIIMEGDIDKQIEYDAYQPTGELGMLLKQLRDALKSGSNKMLMQETSSKVLCKVENNLDPKLAFLLIAELENLAAEIRSNLAERELPEGVEEASSIQMPVFRTWSATSERLQRILITEMMKMRALDLELDERYRSLGVERGLLNRKESQLRQEEHRLERSRMLLELEKEELEEEQKKLMKEKEYFRKERTMYTKHKEKKRKADGSIEEYSSYKKSCHSSKLNSSKRAKERRTLFEEMTSIKETSIKETETGLELTNMHDKKKAGMSSASRPNASEIERKKDNSGLEQDGQTMGDSKQLHVGSSIQEVIIKMESGSEFKPNTLEKNKVSSVSSLGSTIVKGKKELLRRFEAGEQLEMNSTGQQQVNNSQKHVKSFEASHSSASQGSNTKRLSQAMTKQVKNLTTSPSSFVLEQSPVTSNKSARLSNSPFSGSVSKSNPGKRPLVNEKELCKDSSSNQQSKKRHLDQTNTLGVTEIANRAVNKDVIKLLPYELDSNSSKKKDYKLRKRF